MTNRRVLIVDRDQDICEVLVELISGLGPHTVHCANPAVAVVVAALYDIVVLDIGRNSEPASVAVFDICEKANVRCVTMSTDPASNAQLYKPFCLEEFMAAIEDV